MTHTPGPWWYDEHTECIGSPAGWICSLHYYGERKSDVPFGGQANDAHLMAGSPDLLAACKEASYYFHCMTKAERELIEDMMGDPPPVDVLDAAIAKAEQ